MNYPTIPEVRNVRTKRKKEKMSAKDAYCIAEKTDASGLTVDDDPQMLDQSNHNDGGPTPMRKVIDGLGEGL